MGTLSVDKLLRTSTGAASFTLPATDGTVGQVWQTDGAGQLSLGNVSGISVAATTLTASGATTLSGAFTSLGIDDNADAIAITIDSSENVGIGETTPLKKLHLTTSDVAGTITPKYDNSIVLETNSTAGINFFMNDLSEGGLNFGQTGAGVNNTTGEFIFSNYDNHFRWMTSTGGAAAAERMRIDSTGKVGIGTTTPDQQLDITNNQAASTLIQIDNTDTAAAAYSGIRFYRSNNTEGWDIRRQGSTGKLFIASIAGGTPTDRVTFNSDGSVAFGGAVSKSSGSFKIDHPIPEKKDTHWLVHSFVESPKADLIYRGKVDLVSGSATVNIDTAAGMTDGTFILLCDDVQCLTSNETDWDAVKGSVAGNTLTIECENASSTATISWMVIGDRKDDHMTNSGTVWTDSSGKPIIEPLKELEEESE